MDRFHGDWRDVFGAGRIAMDPRKVLLSMGGVIIAGVLSVALPLAVMVVIDAFKVLLGGEAVVLGFLADGDLGELLETAVGFLRYAVREPDVLGAVLLIVLVVFWYVGSYFVTAVSRIAAVEFARGRRISIDEALLFAAEKHRSAFWSVASVVAGICFFGLLHLAFGALARAVNWAGVGYFLAGLLFGFSFLSGFVMAFLCVGLFFGFPMMIPTICAEGTDAFDAVSRSISYFFAHPWRYLWMLAVGGVYSVVNFVLVVAFAVLMVFLSVGWFALGAGEGFMRELWNFLLVGAAPDGTVLGWTGGWFFMVWLVLGGMLLVGYAGSLKWTTFTIVYMVMRHVEDGTEMQEVFIEEELRKLLECPDAGKKGDGNENGNRSRE